MFEIDYTKITSGKLMLSDTEDELSELLAHKRNRLTPSWTDSLILACWCVEQAERYSHWLDKYGKTGSILWKLGRSVFLDKACV